MDNLSHNKVKNAEMTYSRQYCLIESIKNYVLSVHTGAHPQSFVTTPEVEVDEET